MSDQPLTLAVLAQFHRQVILPDIERIVGSTETRLRDEMHTLHDAVLRRLEEMIALEEKYPLRVEVQDLKARVERLHEDLRRLEQRIKPSAKG